jgi:hypothetical protein
VHNNSHEDKVLSFSVKIQGLVLVGCLDNGLKSILLRGRAFFHGENRATTTLLHSFYFGGVALGEFELHVLFWWWMCCSYKE